MSEQRRRGWRIPRTLENMAEILALIAETGETRVSVRWASAALETWPPVIRTAIHALEQRGDLRRVKHSPAEWEPTAHAPRGEAEAKT